MPYEEKDDSAPPRAAPANGWGEDTTGQVVIPALEQYCYFSFITNRNKPKQQEDNETDIEDMQEEEKMTDVAEAPQVKTFRVQGLEELKRTGQSSLPLAYDPGVDLTILVTHFLQENLIEEPKNPWDFEQLLQDVKQGIRTDEEKNGIDDDPMNKTQTAPTSVPVVNPPPGK